MKILVIGAAGQLGHDLLEVLAPEHEVLGVDVDVVDITKAAAVDEVVDGYVPELVINSAAFTNVDRCEAEPELAYAVNGDGAGNAARACSRTGIPLIHVSTDYVFDGTKGEPYLESDPVNPQSVYGKSKLAGEEQVRQALDRHLIVRTAWLFGNHGANFVKTMIKLGRERDALSVVDDQTGCPTYASHLAQAIKGLIDGHLDDPGIYHMTNSGFCTWFDFAAEIFKLAGIVVDLTPTTTAAFGSPAPRPEYSVLANTHAPETKLPDWHQGLQECLAFLGELKPEQRFQPE